MIRNNNIFHIIYSNPSSVRELVGAAVVGEGEGKVKQTHYIKA